jgi:glycine betaine/choline ABC-type transport system substrate-binding protein
MSLVLAASLVFTGLLACAQDDPMQYDGEVRVAAQTVNETVLLAWMAKLLIDQYTGLETTINTDFAASSVLHQAMAGDEIDLYPTWTGTQLTGILRYDGPNLPTEETYKLVKEGFEKNFNMTWSDPIGFNNTYIMAVRQETAEKYNLKKASDLKEQAPNWVLAGDENFDTRLDAYPGWSEAYGITFKDVLPMQYAMIYQAIANEEVDVIAAYSTDARIKKLNLALLPDDKSFFPDYSAAFVIRMDLLEKYPKLLDVVNKLSGTIDEETMSGLNFQYDTGGDPETIAQEFLTSIGLL